MPYQPTESLTISNDTQRQAWPVYKTAVRRKVTDAPHKTWGLDTSNLPDSDAGRYVQAWCDRWSMSPTVIEDDWERQTGLLLMGPKGSGKTTLASIAANHVSDLGHTVKFISASHLHDAHLAAQDMRKRGDEMGALYTETIDNYANWDAWRLLVLDDLGRERDTASDYSRYLIEDVLRERYDDSAPTIVTTNLSLEQIGKRYGERMESLAHELFWIVPVTGPDRRRRRHG